MNNFRVNGKDDVDSRFDEGFQQVWYYNTTDNALPEGAAVGYTATCLIGKDLTEAEIAAIEARLPGVKTGKNLYSWHPNVKAKHRRGGQPMVRITIVLISFRYLLNMKTINGLLSITKKVREIILYIAFQKLNCC